LADKALDDFFQTENVKKKIAKNVFSFQIK